MTFQEACAAQQEAIDSQAREQATMTFGQALEELKKGYRLCRSGWNGKGMWIALQVPDAHSKMGLPYLYMKTAQGPLVPWLASQTDILAEDWSIRQPEEAPCSTQST